MARDFRSYILNEVKWWSNWAKLEWLEKGAYMFTSLAFREPLFNHLGLIEPPAGLSNILPDTEARFEASGILPSVFLPRSFHDERSCLQQLGYGRTDQMFVMEIGQPNLDVNPDVRLEMVDIVSTEWVTVYLQSFYGSLALFRQVTGALRKATAMDGTRLVLARVGGTPVGTMALCRTGRVMGAYCVGTLPAYRRSGIATSMLSFAQQVAEESGCKLILQAFHSDSLRGFYTDRGFKLAFVKDVFSKCV